MKYLITGLGNIGSEYWGTRHNIGFRVVNHLVESVGGNFTEERYGAIARIRVKNCDLIVLKPNTFMNLSGNAVRYWLQKENIPVENLLIVVDDLALPFGTLRLKPKGSDAGHNGLKNIAQLLNTQEKSLKISRKSFLCVNVKFFICSIYVVPVPLLHTETVIDFSRIFF